MSEFESLSQIYMSSQLPVNERPATRMENELPDSKRLHESNESRMDEMKSQLAWITSQVSALEKEMPAVKAYYGQSLAEDDDTDEAASDIVVAATRKRRRDEDDDPDPVVASEEEVAYMRANDRNFEMSFVRSESPVWDTSRTARSETFGREAEDDEHPSKRQRSEDWESISDGWISDEELYEGEPVYPGPMQVIDERIPAPVEVGEWYSYPSPMQRSDQRFPAPVEVGEWFQRPVRSAGMQSPEIFLDTGFAQSLLPPSPLSRQEVFQAQFEGEMTGELLADYPLAQDTIEGLPDLSSGSAFTAQRERTHDVSESVENDSACNGSKLEFEDHSEQAEAVSLDMNTEQPTDLEDLAAYYERVAHLARQPAVVLYIRDAFSNFRVHKRTHPNSQITATDVRQKLRFILEREAMVPAVQDWLTYPLPVALIRADREANEDTPAESRSTPESDCPSCDPGYGWGHAAYASDGDDPEYGSFHGFEDEEQEVPESASSGLSPARSPQEDAAAAVEALRHRYIECANTWTATTKGHTCGILHAMPWGRMEDAHLEEIPALKVRLILQERYDRCAAQWPMFGSHNCELDGEDRSAEDLWTLHETKVKSIQYRRDRYEACVVRWSVYGRHTCGVEGESESDRLQESHLREC